MAYLKLKVAFPISKNRSMKHDWKEVSKGETKI